MAEMKSPDRTPELNFRPLTEGLGFHPFSNGMPYTPTARPPAPAPRPMGTGAVAAGPPSFATSLPAPPARPAVPSARYTPAAPIAPAIPHPAAAGLAASEEEFGFGYLLKRALAYALDSALNFTLCAGALLASLWEQGLALDALLNPGVVLLAGLFVLFFSWALVTAQEVAFGTSFGKRLFGLYLEGPTSALILRSLLFIPSVLFCGLGLFWSVADPKRRCWHDLASGTQPGEIASL